MAQLARNAKWQEKARTVGAKGLRVISNIDTGQEMIQRWDTDDAFYGFTGNWIMQVAFIRGVLPQRNSSESSSLSVGNTPRGLPSINPTI